MKKACIFIAVVFIICNTAFDSEQATEEKNLVAKTEGGRVVICTSGERIADNLIDGDTGTTYSTKYKAGFPQEIVLSFHKDQIGIIDKAILILGSEKDKKYWPKDFELLVSLTNPVSGFFLVDDFTVAEQEGPRTFSFPPVKAKFIKLRIKSNFGGRKAVLNELQIWGRLPREPEFFVSIMDRNKFNNFLSLKERGALVPITLTSLERELFEDSMDGRLDTFTLEEGALIASEVDDKASLREYAEKVDEIYEKVKLLIKFTKRDKKSKAESIFKQLHGVFLKGYRKHATDFDELLDTQNYNCVSSAVLYNVVGKRFGLDLRGIEVPEHVFSILYLDDETIDIETTTPHGFDPIRNKQKLKEFEEKTGFVYIPDKHSKQRREVEDVGMIAIVYNNRGTGLVKKKKFEEAIVAYNKALELDPGSSLALKNLIGSYVNWGNELAKKNEYQTAISVYKEGLAIDSLNLVLNSNLEAAYNNWGIFEAKNKRYEESFEVFQKALAEDPDNYYYKRNLFGSYGQYAMDLLEQGRPKEAMAIVGRAFDRFPGEKKLRELKVNVYNAWALSEYETENFDEAIRICNEGLSFWPKNRILRNNRNFFYIKRSDYHLERDDREMAVALALEARKLYPKERDFKNYLSILYDKPAREAMADGDYQTAIDLYNEGLSADSALKDLAHNRTICYIKWTEHLIESGYRHDGITKVLEARQLYPKDRNLKNFLFSVFHNPAYEAFERGEYQKAIDLYNEGLAIDGTLKDLAKNRTFVYTKWAEHLMSSGRKSEAIAKILQARKLYPKDRNLRNYLLSIFNKPAIEESEKGNFQDAINICNEGLRLDPALTELKKNRAYFYDQWAKGYMDANNYARALKIYEQGLREDPNNRILKNNYKYCRQKLYGW